MPNDKTRLGARVDSRNTVHRRPPVEYVYHWDRIFGASAVLLLVIGGIGYGMYQWLGPAAEPVVAQTVEKIPGEEQASPRAQDQHEEPAKEEVLPTDSGSAELQLAMVDPSTGEAAKAGAPAISVVPVAAAPVASDVPEAMARATRQVADTAAPTAEVDFEVAPVATAEASDATEPAGTAASEPAAEVVDDAPTEPKALQADSEPAQPPQPPVHRALFRLQDISVVSPAVERFQLAKSVINNEPRGDIEAIVPKVDGAAAVYCFSDVVGMKDKVLYYHWLRGGKRVAKVRVGAWGKRWRSHSSKILNPTMKGDWRVELRKADNTLLASAEFVYR